MLSCEWSITHPMQQGCPSSTVNCVVFWPIRWKVHGAALKDFLMTSPGRSSPWIQNPLQYSSSCIIIPTFNLRSAGCSVILVAGNWASLLIKKCQNCYCVLDLFWHDNILAKPRSKMTTVPNFSRENDAGLRELNFVLWKSRNRSRPSPRIEAPNYEGLRSFRSVNKESSRFTLV